MIVQLPLGRGTERMAVRSGSLASAAQGPLRLVDPSGTPTRYCATCAAPIEFGAVWRAEQAYCSVECTLGSDQPA